MTEERAAAGDGGVRPVWVLTGTGSGWAPGLLREWTRAEDRSWQGVVVMVQGGEVGEWLVPGAMLRPGGESPAWAGWVGA